MEIENYDSTKDTLSHIKEDTDNLLGCLNIILERIKFHDKSKLDNPEKQIFDEFTPKLKNTTYGSENYKDNLEKMGEALNHHYENNSHHPEHYSNGINGMNLFDILEMLMDWLAATKRHKDGNIMESLKINKERFNISDQLFDILHNTILLFNLKEK
jgi:hypothetical protein